MDIRIFTFPDEVHSTADTLARLPVDYPQWPDQEGHRRRLAAYRHAITNFPSDDPAVDPDKPRAPQDRTRYVNFIEADRGDGIDVPEGEIHYVLTEKWGGAPNPHVSVVFVVDRTQLSPEQITTLRNQIDAIDGLQPHPGSGDTVLVYSQGTDVESMGRDVAVAVADIEHTDGMIGVYPLTPGISRILLAQEVQRNVDRRWNRIQEDVEGAVAFEEEWQDLSGLPGPQPGDSDEIIVDMTPDVRQRPTVITAGVGDVSDPAVVWRGPLRELAEEAINAENARGPDFGPEAPPALQALVMQRALEQALHRAATDPTSGSPPDSPPPNDPRSDPSGPPSGPSDPRSGPSGPRSGPTTRR